MDWFFCDLLVRVEGKTAFFSTPVSFAAEDVSASALPCLCLRVLKEKELAVPTPDFSLPPLCFWRSQQTGDVVLWNSYTRNAVLRVTQGDWQHPALHVTAQAAANACMNLLMAAFLPCLAAHNGFMMHGALVEYRGEAIIFTASSGVGKSTQADLWHNHLGAEILNGDKAFVRKTQDSWTAYGSPWSGSSPYVKNKKAPLKAIVVLRQAKENAIRRLSGFELLQMVTTHIYYPSWDAEAAGQTMQTLDALLGEVPVYLLSCLPNQAAAELARDRIYGSITKGVCGS